MNAVVTRLKSWINRNADHLVTGFVPATGAEALQPQQSYVRLWLTDMFLERDREWFQNRYPMVHATVDLSYAGNRASLSAVARAPEGRIGRGERRNYPLTPLLPWSGGVIEVEAGLSALAGANVLAPALDVLQQVSRLVTPPLSATLGVAGEVGTAINSLLRSGEDPVVLGVHEGFAAEGGGGLVLRPGHLVAVAETPSRLDLKSLSVIDGMLQVTRNGNAEQLTGADYMVVEVAGLKERDDWRFPALEELIKKAIESAVGDRQRFDAYRSAALSMALTSSDLTPTDRQRVARAVRNELAEAQAFGEGAVGREPPSLDVIVARHAMPLQDAETAPHLTLNELLAGEG